jgi:membrane-bound serine protease (ClpP class)
MSLGDTLAGLIGNAVGFCRIDALPPTVENAALLLLIAAVFITAEALTATKGFLAVIGAVALFSGLKMVLDLNLPDLGLSSRASATIYAATAIIALFTGLFVRWLSQQRTTTGAEELLNATGVVRQWSGNCGVIHITGEDWKAVCYDAALKPGDAVRPVTLNGLVLTVTQITK